MNRTVQIVGGIILTLVAVLIILHRSGVVSTGQPNTVSDDISDQTLLMPAMMADRRRATEDDTSKQQNARLARIASERTEAMREAGILAKKNAPNYRLLDDEGQLTKQAIREAGLNEDEVDALQGIFDTAWEQVSKTLSASAKLDSKGSDPEQGIFVYDIASLADGGSSVTSSIEKKIKDLVGGGAANLLIDAFDPNHCLCGFGKYDIRIELHYPTDSGGQPTARYTFTYPATSQVVERGEVSQDSFYRLFGTVVERIHKE